MEFRAHLFDPLTVKTDCLVIAVPAKGELSPVARAVDEASGALISEARKQGDLAKFLDTLNLFKPQGIKATRLVLVSTGSKESLTPTEFGKLATRIATATRSRGIRQVAVCLDNLAATTQDGEQSATELARKFIEGQYSFDQYKSQKSDRPRLSRLDLHGTGDGRALTAALNRGAAIGRGINLTRELGDLPANVCTPTYLASRARGLAKGAARLSLKVLTESQMKELKMGSLLSVTAGTETPAKLIILEYKGGRKTDKPTVLVGKGVTFDTGGISLKPGGGMDEMKYDMCGAASVLGAMAAVNELALPINLIGIIPAVENMPSGKATRPGDIVTSMSGQTIEILNTDAEGRLILCDALTYAERYKPRAVIDIATLTGACVVALGNHVSGLFSNNEDLADALHRAGEASGDKAWRLPMDDDYNQQLKSPFADMANVGGKGAGSITAACFLGRFTKNYPWAHLDIAGTAWKSGAQKGATGRPVSLLVEYLRSLA